MAEEQGKGIQQIEGCEVIYDMGSGLVIAKVPLDKVKEQDINARIMKNEMQDQLTANIKKRGQLESLPLFVLVDGKLEIISGHHRVKSARAAEMKEIIATDALLVHPATEYVRNFIFDYSSGDAVVSFIVKGAQWEEEETISTVFEKGVS